MICNGILWQLDLSTTYSKRYLLSLSHTCTFLFGLFIKCQNCEGFGKIENCTLNKFKTDITWTLSNMLNSGIHLFFSNMLNPLILLNLSPLNATPTSSSRSASTKRSCHQKQNIKNTAYATACCASPTQSPPWSLMASSMPSRWAWRHSHSMATTLFTPSLPTKVACDVKLPMWDAATTCVSSGIVGELLVEELGSDVVGTVGVEENRAWLTSIPGNMSVRDVYQNTVRWWSE